MGMSQLMQSVISEHHVRCYPGSLITIFCAAVDYPPKGMIDRNAIGEDL
jgi:hypothetical protein